VGARVFEGAAKTLVAGLASWGKGGFGRRKGGRLLGTLCWWWPGWSGNLPEIAGEAPPLRSIAAQHERVVPVAGMRHGWNSGCLHGFGKAGSRLGGGGFAHLPAVTRFGGGAEKEEEVRGRRREAPAATSRMVSRSRSLSGSFCA
jgi:hypothetical protein